MSTVLVKDDESSVASGAAEAIIEEARHRQHRRWLWRAMAVALAALAIGLALAFSVGGSASSSHGRLGSSPSGFLALRGPRTTVEGGLLMGQGHKLVNGTVRFVANHGHKTYTAKANNGHWKIKLPAGTYIVQGLSTQVPGGRHWSRAVHLVVRPGRPVANVDVEYSIPTG